MTKIKICGITCEDEIVFLNRYLPDFAGFVFAESRRLVSAEKAAKLASMLVPSIIKAGVFVNAEIDHIIETAAAASLDVIQLHGDETCEFISMLRQKLGIRHMRENESLEIEIWKGIRVRDKGSLDKLEHFGADRYLLDSWTDGTYGGSGRSFDWQLAAAVMRNSKAEHNDMFIVAGGLNPENAGEAVIRLKPYAVDVSSGVETDGKKDEKKVRDFIDSVRQAL